MFKAGNLIRLITEDGDGEIVRVLEDESHGLLLHIAIGNDNSEGWVSPDDYELVTESLLEQEIPENPTPKTVSNRTIEDIHTDIENMMMQLAQHYRATDLGEKFTMTIEAETFQGDDHLTVKYTATVGYGTSVTTRRLDRSVQLVLDRMQENKTLAPEAISFQR